MNDTDNGPEDDDAIEVVAIDQWSQSGDLSEWTYDQMKATIEDCDDGQIPDIDGGDADAAAAMFGGRFDVKTVEPGDSPKKGIVWFVEGDDGGLEPYAKNYATK